MRSVRHQFLLLVLVSWIASNAGIARASHRTYMHLQSVKHNIKTVGRTGYHFQPTRNWINDPNGPLYYNGVYHLFYQYNPKGAVWGNIVWAHSVSRDLINWRRMPVAIAPSQPFDRFGCWSGSATIRTDPDGQHGSPIIFYTGIVDANNTQVQNYAVPADLSDPYLQVWVKPKDNPMIMPDLSVNRTAFRDPTTAWFGPDGDWRLTLGGREGDTGVTHLYRASWDLTRWTKVDHPLHSTAGTGNWECPDFYPVAIKGKNGVDTSTRSWSGVRHVLKVSLDVTRYEYYTIGLYDNDTYIPDKGMIDGWKGLRYDYGNFYASKSFYDPSRKRRILWGWANESDSTADDIAKGWAGIQLIPRTIWLDPSGKQLLQWPIKEVEKLRGRKAELWNWTLTKGKKVAITGITTNQADVEVVFSIPSLDKAEPFNPSWDRYDAQKLCGMKGSAVQGGLGPFGLATLASRNLEEYTPVFFRVFKDRKKYLVLMCSDASRSSLKNATGSYRPSFAGFVDVDLTRSKTLSLRSLIDNSVVESFGAGGKTCISSRVYPTLAIYNYAHLYVFNNGSQEINVDKLTAWSMNQSRLMNQ